ncbi:MAG: MauE/DoxX family redox-associated membrane protein [Chitinophagaceae bacterium]
MKRTTIIETIVVAYTILFLYTAISKLMEYSVFKEQIAASPILAPVSKLIAAGLPWTEILVTVLLIVPRWRLKGLYASLILMTAFTIYIAATLAFSEHIPCSCGGIISEMSWTQHLLFNTVFIGLAITGIILTKKVLNDHKLQWSSATIRDWNIKPENI